MVIGTNSCIITGRHLEKYKNVLPLWQFLKQFLEYEVLAQL